MPGYPVNRTFAPSMKKSRAKIIRPFLVVYAKLFTEDKQFSSSILFPPSIFATFQLRFLIIQLIIIRNHVFETDDKSGGVQIVHFNVTLHSRNVLTRRQFFSFSLNFDKLTVRKNRDFPIIYYSNELIRAAKFSTIFNSSKNS